MPSGSGRSGGGHFGGGSFSHSGGHFSGGRSVSHSGGHFAGSRSGFSHPRPYRPWYGPRVIVFGGRQVYLNSGRASTVSVLGVLIIIALIVTACLGFGWMGVEDDLKIIKSDYTYYHAMAEKAAVNSDYLLENVTVTRIEQYNLTGKYCIFYEFSPSFGVTPVTGYSFYVYNHDEALSLQRDGVDLALDSPKTRITDNTDSVPLSYKDKTLDDDAEYLDKLDSRDACRVGTFVAAGIAVLLILANVLIRATASKATAEQIAASKNGNNTSSETQTPSTPAGTWHCAYCGTLNDNSKERCEGCGAMRQK